MRKTKLLLKKGHGIQVEFEIIIVITVNFANKTISVKKSSEKNYNHFFKSLNIFVMF
jgi:hypothetical protein